jgi:choline dehydrogenase
MESLMEEDSYIFPYMDRPNLTHALVTRVTFKGKQATGVEIAYDSKTSRISAGLEVVLSLVRSTHRGAL